MIFIIKTKWVHQMGQDARKPVFMVSDEVRFKPDCSATETSWKFEILLVASLVWILSTKQITNVLIRLSDVQAGLPLCHSQTSKTGLLASGPK